MKEKLLFVTKGGENSEDGFSYVFELAKTLNAGIAILMIFDKRTASIEDVMTAAAFAEEGEADTAKEILTEHKNEIKEIADKEFRRLSEKYSEISRDLIYQVASGDVITAIRDFLKDKPVIDMVLLSPNLSRDKKVINVKKLLKNISKPIVTISRPAEAGI
ncbi:MAG: hypothetical protein AB1632_14105 [Nitrospirota bacterium]